MIATWFLAVLAIRNYFLILKLRSRKKVRVLFFVTQSQLWAADSLVAHLIGDNRFSILICALPNNEASEQEWLFTAEENYRFFAAKGLPVIKVASKSYYERMSNDPLNCDIVFYDQPISILPENLSYKRYLYRSLICYIPYSFDVSILSAWSYATDFHRKAWRIFAQSAWSKNRYIKVGSRSKTNVIVSGYPKLDELLIPPTDSDYSLWPRASTAQHRLIWAPHWSFGSTNQLNYGTFDLFFEFIYDLAVKTTEIDWIFRPHQRLRYELQKSLLMNLDEYDDYLAKWDCLPNAQVHTEGSYSSLFKTSTCMFTDCGSFLVEYLLTGRPLVHLINPASVGYNSFCEKILPAYYKVHDQIELANALEELVLMRIDPLKDKRKEISDQLRLCRSEAGQNIYKYICNSIFG